AAWPRGHVLALHVLVRGRPGPRRPAHRGGADLPEDAHLRQPPRPVLRGDRTHRRATRQLPAGVQPPVPHQRGDQSRLPTRPRRGRRCRSTGPGVTRGCRGERYSIAAIRRIWKANAISPTPMTSPLIPVMITTVASDRPGQNVNISPIAIET